MMKKAVAHPIAYSAVAPQRFADFVALTKPRLNFLVVVTAAVAYYLGAGASLDVSKLAATVLGIALVAGGAAGLNQVYERDTDSLMWRTRARPLAAHRVTVGEATGFSIALVVVGLVIVLAASNLLAAALALLTVVSYNVIYTPMKRRSQFATLVGAVPGALPPMIGWVAADGALSWEAWALFAIVFVWQIPHFMAIAWLYRDDFGRAGFPMLPVIDPDGRSTARQAVWFSLALVPLTLMPYFLGMSGLAYAVGATLGGCALLALAALFAVNRTDERARLLFVGSIVYLPVLWILLVGSPR